MTASPLPSAPASPAPDAALSGVPAVQLENLWQRYRRRPQPGRRRTDPSLGPEATPGSGERPDAEGWTLRGIDLHLDPGELVGLLGPSGCGKTTLLRLIAGFERPERGCVHIGGRLVAGAQRWLEPERRGVGMVFQDYALFPHLDAWHNACFGLRPRQDRSRVLHLLQLLGLSGLEQRYPHELSGGQRQRLALARALAPGNGVVLLDEPFSNLDVEVRLRLRSELPAVLADCGAGGLLVTHDPEEALAVCDRVAVLHEGRLHQCASPRDLVRRPATAFVGRFVLQGNLLPARREGSRLLTDLGPFAAGEHATAEAVGTAPAASAIAAAAAGEGESALQVLLTPEALTLAPLGNGESSDSTAGMGRARVQGREFLGREWLYTVELNGRALRVRLPLEQHHDRGQLCHLRLQPGAQGLLYPGALPVQPIVLA